jgi:hypothetical protein
MESRTRFVLFKSSQQQPPSAQTKLQVETAELEPITTAIPPVTALPNLNDLPKARKRSAKLAELSFT